MVSARARRASIVPTSNFVGGFTMESIVRPRAWLKAKDVIAKPYRFEIRYASDHELPLLLVETDLQGFFTTAPPIVDVFSRWLKEGVKWEELSATVWCVCGGTEETDGYLTIQRM